MSIPYTDEGYAVEPSGVVHRRYADHAVGAQRTRSLVGALSLLGAAEPMACELCFPPTPTERRRPRRRDREEPGPPYLPEPEAPEVEAPGSNVEWVVAESDVVETVDAEDE